jgi:hypothetical protein
MGFSKKKKILTRKKQIGGSETHTCADGTTFTCPGGTQDCYDNSPTYCSSKVGNTTTIKCQDGSTRQCSAGTEGCFNFSPSLCGNQPGGPKVIMCGDGTVEVCNSSSPACFDDSPIFCPQRQLPGAPITIPCRDGSSVTCNSGTQGCFAFSPTYCGEPVPVWSTQLIDNDIDVCRLTSSTFNLTFEGNDKDKIYNKIESDGLTNSDEYITLTYFRSGDYVNILGKLNGVNRIDGRVRLTLTDSKISNSRGNSFSVGNCKKISNGVIGYSSI